MITQGETRSIYLVRRNDLAQSVCDAKLYHTYTAKLLYFAMRSHPEMLTTVAFSTTHVQATVVDDMAKLLAHWGT